MARPSLPPTGARPPRPLYLSDVDIVSAAEDDEAATSIDGAAVAALLDVGTDADRVLDAEDIALELEHVADLLGALAEHATRPTGGALALAEHCLRRLAARVDGLRPGARSRARRFVIATHVREAPREYTARWTRSVTGAAPTVWGELTEGERVLLEARGPSMASVDAKRAC